MRVTKARYPILVEHDVNPSRTKKIVSDHNRGSLNQVFGKQNFKLEQEFASDKVKIKISQVIILTRQTFNYDKREVSDQNRTWANTNICIRSQ